MKSIVITICLLLAFYAKAADSSVLDILIDRNLQSLGTILDCLGRTETKHKEDLRFAAVKNEMCAMAFIYWQHHRAENDNLKTLTKIQVIISLERKNIVDSPAFRNMDPLGILANGKDLRSSSEAVWGGFPIDPATLTKQSYSEAVEHFAVWLLKLSQK